MYECIGGHTFIFAGDPDKDEIPEGYPCACGQTIATYKTCSTCGNRELIPKPVDYTKEQLQEAIDLGISS